MTVPKKMNTLMLVTFDPRRLESSHFRNIYLLRLRWHIQQKKVRFPLELRKRASLESPLLLPLAIIHLAPAFALA